MHQKVKNITILFVHPREPDSKKNEGVLEIYS